MVSAMLLWILFPFTRTLGVFLFFIVYVQSVVAGFTTSYYFRIDCYVQSYLLWVNTIIISPFVLYFMVIYEQVKFQAANNILKKTSNIKNANLIFKNKTIPQFLFYLTDPKDIE